MSEEENVAEETTVEEEEQSQGVTISLANREFLRNNYKKLDMPSLCIATGMSPEVIAMYIEAYEDYLERNDGSVNEKCNFTMSVDEHGNVSFSLQWPTLEKSEKILPYLGKAMYLLHSGRLKENVVQFFIQMGEEKGNYQIIKSVIGGWKEQENARAEAPLVAPNEVLV